MLSWLKADLAANRNHRCTVVYGHHPYLSSAAPYYGQPDLKAIWPTLVLEDVDLFIAGHNHAYERLPESEPRATWTRTGGLGTATTATPEYPSSWRGPVAGH